MGTSLFNTTPAATYPALLKVGDNSTIDTTLKTLSDGSGNDSTLQLSTRRLGILQDTGVTTQTSSVIQATTTNANLVIAPNGTGALIASIPDGTATGGSARGDNSVDLQTSRTANTEVASGNLSTILGGERNTATGAWSIVLSGRLNKANANSAISGGDNSNVSGTNSVGIGTDLIVSGANATAFGRTNTVSSQYGVVSGGQSNTASSSTHATVVGGQSNTASGTWSITGGSGNTASGGPSVALGINNIASGLRSTALGFQNTASGRGSTAIGILNTASGDSSLATGVRSKSYLSGQIANAWDQFIQVGDAQNSLLTSRKLASLTTGGTTVLSIDGTGVTELIIPDGTNRMWNVQVRWVAVVTDITGTATGVTVGDTKSSTDLLAVAKRGGITTVSAHTSAGTHAIETIAGSLTLANITYTAGASQEMAITFTGPTFVGGGSVTMRVVAAISLTEVAY
jgi:hypothetical protein